MSGRFTNRGRAQLLALVVLGAVFVAGALAGAAFDRVSGGEEPPGHQGGRAHRAAAIFAPEGPLGERLALTSDQRREVEAILADHGRDAEEVLQEMRPRLQAIFERTTESVRAVLDAEQQAELDEYLQERRETLRKRYEEPKGQGSHSGRRHSRGEG